MATWTHVPQEALDEALEADVRVAQVTPARAWVGRMSAEYSRVFRLRYTLVTSADAAAMVAFFVARRGSFESFDWVSLNDGQTYSVRFDDAMRVEMFTPAFFRQGGDVVFRVVP